MTYFFAVLVALLPLSLAAHPNHPEGSPHSLADVLHYIFSFDHYAGTIAVIVGGIVFIAYRNIRRKLRGDRGEEASEHTDPRSRR
jgi:hydrogenase/urease accessory protein HupE